MHARAGGVGSRAPANIAVVSTFRSDTGSVFTCRRQVVQVETFEEARRMIGGVVMSEITHEEALRQADALVGQALRETEARCTVLGQYINDCEDNGSKTAGWSEALRELHALHGYRRRLMRRRSLIQQALDCLVGDCPTKAPLTPSPDRTVVRTQQQVQIRARRRS